MSDTTHRVLLTGATGYIAGQLLPTFRARYELDSIDVRDTDRDGNRIEGVEVLDLLDDPDDRFTELCRGVDTIVHCGHHQADPPSYAQERINVDIAARVFETAASTGVRRVVCTSTNQASKWYEHPWKQGLIDRVGPQDYPRPESFYGWAKVAYEALGHLYATGEIGPVVENVQIRIVAPREIELANYTERSLVDYLRDITGYVSPRDLQQLYLRSIEAESIADEFGVPFQIFYGVSNNTRKYWSITNARKVVGYEPEDDSELLFADDIAAMITRG